MRSALVATLTLTVLLGCTARRTRCCPDPTPQDAPPPTAVQPAPTDRSPALKAVANASTEEAMQHVIDVLAAEDIHAIGTSTAPGGTVHVSVDDVVKALDVLQVALRKLRFSADHPTAQFEVVLP